MNLKTNTCHDDVLQFALGVHAAKSPFGRSLAVLASKATAQDARLLLLELQFVCFSNQQYLVPSWKSVPVMSVV